MRLQLQVVLMGVLVCLVHCQRPFYAPLPWQDGYSFGAATSRDNATATRVQTDPPPVQQSNNPAAGGAGASTLPSNPTLVPTNPGGSRFRFFNNVPIEGPQEPCVGCLYRLSAQGFIRAELPSPNRIQ